MYQWKQGDMNIKQLNLTILIAFCENMRYLKMMFTLIVNGHEKKSLKKKRYIF